MMKRMSKALALLVSCLLLVGLFAACSNSGSSSTPAGGSSAAAGGENQGTVDAGDKMVVKVGVMTPLSGSSSRFGEVYRASIEAAVRAIDEDGFLEDYTLEFEFVDDKGTTDGAPTAATYVIDNYGAHVSIGHMLTTMILATGQYFEDAQIPLLGIVSGPASVDQGWDFLSIETGTDLAQADTLMEYLVEVKGFETFGLIHVNTEGGMSAADRIEDLLANEYSLTLATRDAMTNDDMDFTAQILKMKDAGVDCVIFWGLNQSNGNICRNQIDQLWGDVPDEIFFAGGTSMAQNQMLETWAEDEIQGVVFPVGYIPDESNPEIVRFIEYFRDADPLSQDPADVPARVYDAVWHIAHALNALDGYSVDEADFTVKLNEALRNAEFDGVQGHFNYGAFDNGEGLGQMNVGEWGPDYSQSKVYP